MVFVKRLNEKFWLWSDEEKMVACFANKSELSILFQKRFRAEFAEMINFYEAREKWQSFRVAANNDVIIFTEA
jgi:hypothetical protein